VKRARSRNQESGTLNTFEPDPNAELELADTVVGDVGDRISVATQEDFPSRLLAVELPMR
jgi:hypothetical protein